MKQLTTNSPAYITLDGSSDSSSPTVASMAPIACATEENIPARMKTQIISRTLLSPAPRAKVSKRLSRECPSGNTIA